MRPKILLIENSIDVTGALNSALHTAVFLRETFEFVFVLPKGSKAIEVVQTSGFEVIELQMREIRKNIFDLLVYLPSLLINAFRLVGIIRKHKVASILNNDFYNLLPVVLRILVPRIHYVCYVRFLPDRFPKLLRSVWFGLHNRYSAALVVVSEAVRQRLPNSSKVVVIGNEHPVDTHLPFDPSSRVILYPANYTRGKGQQYALEAFKEIHMRYPDWRLKFVGSDLGLAKNRQFREELQERSRELKYGSAVEFQGFCPTIREEYARAGIVLMFSESESFSLICLEAMFFERPLIATRCGGPEEIVKNEETGLLVANRSVAEMQSAMQTLIEDPSLRAFLAGNARRDVLARFSPEKTTRKLVPLLNSAINRSET